MVQFFIQAEMLSLNFHFRALACILFNQVTYHFHTHSYFGMEASLKPVSPQGLFRHHSYTASELEVHPPRQLNPPPRGGFEPRSIHYGCKVILIKGNCFTLEVYTADALCEHVQVNTRSMRQECINK